MFQQVPTKLCLAIVLVTLFQTIWVVHSHLDGFEPTRVRTYYIQAEEAEWDYAPTGMDMFMGMDLPAELKNSATTIGRKYLKGLYREYTGPDFKTRKYQPIHLGFLGPVIRAVVGERIKVVFKNTLHFPASIHPHGVFYDKNSEGAGYIDDTDGFVTKGSGDSVKPGETFTYQFDVPERAGPIAGGPSSAGWLYHSHALDEPPETQAGLIGFIVITRASKAKKNARPKDVDREFFVTPKIIDEQTSFFLEKNIQKYLNATGQLPSDFNRASLTATNQKDSINGYMLNNAPGFNMCNGEKVRWYIGTVGNFDLHPVHWHVNVGTEDNFRRVDSVFIAPGMNRVIDMEIDNHGTWLFHCHIDNHMMDGMTAVYRVFSKTSEVCKAVKKCSKSEYMVDAAFLEAAAELSKGSGHM